MTVPDQETLDALVERLGEFTVPLFERHGVHTHGVFTGLGGPAGVAGPELAVYHWVSHDTEDASASWQGIRDESHGVVRAPLDVTTTTIALDALPQLARDLAAELDGVVPASAEDGRVYELRLYSPLPDMTGALVKRFEYFTLGLFDRYGLGNVAFFLERGDAVAPAPGTTPVANPVADSTEPRMAFVLAHPSLEAALETWRQVAVDPDGVPDDGLPKSQLAGKTISYLRPTAYSPLR
ncbi:hypothetical protein GCM10025780_27230 [Frondihabitans cladoniiphilus]|uniref:NIPSNAP protein n=2 Tax=Frondihabitans cladoniiphilus TaxID=715785 RepID=A0ABP8W4T1_9MICO